MNPADQFTAWRAELVTEFEATTAELTTARAASAAANLAHAEARSAFHELNEFAAGAVGKHGSMAASLHSRLMNSRETLTAAERARGAPIESVKSLLQRMADLQLAVDQIDRALTAAKVTQLPRAAEPPTRRKPAPIEFDNITMPREAVVP